MSVLTTFAGITKALPRLLTLTLHKYCFEWVMDRAPQAVDLLVEYVHIKFIASSVVPALALNSGDTTRWAQCIGVGSGVGSVVVWAASQVAE